MNWDDLRFFLAVYRNSTFVAAGRELGVNSTTVSRRLERLEGDLGTTLFRRTPEGLSPTVGGQRVYEQTRLIEGAVEKINTFAGGNDVALRGAVTLSTVHTYTSNFLMKHLWEFASLYPEIDVLVKNNDSFDNLIEGSVDLLLRFRRPEDGPEIPETTDAVILRSLGEVGISVYASRSYLEKRGMPKDAFSVEGHDVIMPGEDTTHNIPGYPWCREVEQAAKATFFVADMTSVIAAATSSFGLACLPNFIAAEHPSLVSIDDQLVDVQQTWLLMRTAQREVARIRALHGFLVDLHQRYAEEIAGEWTYAESGALT